MSKAFVYAEVTPRGGTQSDGSRAAHQGPLPGRGRGRRRGGLSAKTGATLMSSAVDLLDTSRARTAIFGGNTFVDIAGRNAEDRHREAQVVRGGAVGGPQLIEEVKARKG